MRALSFTRPIITMSALLLLGGCLGLGGGTPPTRMYMLQALPGPEAGSPTAASDPAVVVGPIKLANYLQRSNIVTYSRQNELQIADFDKWAEPLEEGFARVLGESLSQLIPTNRIMLFPWRRALRIDYQVSVGVVQFGTTAEDEAVLTARWHLLGKDGKTVLASRRSHFTAPVTGDDYDARVSAMSQTLADLSREIAAEVKARAR